MMRRLLLLVGSMLVTAVTLGASLALGLPLPWLGVLGLAQVGIMWWGMPWAAGSMAGSMVSLWLTGVSTPGVLLLAGLAFAIQGLIPRIAFLRQRLLFDIGDETALSAFLAFGVLLNSFLSALFVTGVWGDILGSEALTNAVALVWLAHSLAALVIALPLLRFVTWRLPNRGLWATPAARLRSIRRPQLTLQDFGLLVAMVAVVAALSLAIHDLTALPPLFINVLFLIPIVVLMAQRGFDGALIAAALSLIVAVIVALQFYPLDEQTSLPVARDSFATVIFSLGIYYLISIVVGLLLDAQRAERLRLTMLLNLNHLINEAGPEGSLLERFTKVVQQAMAGSACAILYHDQSAGALRPLAWAADTANNRFDEALDLRLFPILEEPIIRREAVILHHEDAQQHPSASVLWLETGFITAMFIPLQGAEEVFGVVGVFDGRPERAFTGAELRLVEAMSDQVARALEQQRLIGALRTQTAQLNAVAEVAAVLNSTLDPEGVYRHITHYIGRLVPHDWSAVLVPSGPLHYQMAMVAGDAATADEDTPKELSLARELDTRIRQPQALPVRMAVADDGDWGEILRGLGMTSALFVPLLREEALLGVLLLASADSAAFGDYEALSLLGRHMSLAIANAQLYAELEAAYQAKEHAHAALLKTERLRALGELASGIAHDFNNLLAGILGHTQLMLMEGQGSGAGDGLRVIEQAARDGTQMVHRIQQFAKAGQRRQLDVYDLNEIIQDVLALTRPRWQHRGAKGAITTVVETEAMPPFWGSAHELREVLTNLILNALDAMPEGGTLTLRSEYRDNEFLVHVIDTGVGMSEEVQAAMWTPFFSTKGAHGTGLGLPMAHTIVVQRHGGRIAVESAEGRGTAITLYLPDQRPQPGPAGIVDESPPGEIGAVLVVEGDERVRSALAQILAGWDYPVAVAADGGAALEALEQGRFDIVILASNLLDLSAWAVALQAKQRQPGIAVIVLSTWTERDIAAQSGVFDAMLPKPFEADQLQRTIGDLLAQKSSIS